MSSREMYQQHILENYRNPDNFGKLDSPTHQSTMHNPLCGDDISINLSIINNKLKGIKFTGNGCAISIASSSLTTEKVKDMNINEIMNLKKEFVLELLQIPISQVRLKCALLPLEAIQKAIENEPTRN